MIKDLIPRSAKAALSLWKDLRSGRKFADQLVWRHDLPAGRPNDNALREFFRNRNAGAGIWKWEHYFDIYDRHLRKFRGKPVRIVEVGIYSGGSLDMWQSYFGPQAEIVGVDIEPACKRYERSGVKVYIGDQADRAFWGRLRAEVPSIDIIIDDGGHKPHQQVATMEELVPHLNPGGVYICEDVHGTDNRFLQHMYGLATRLNSMDGFREAPEDAERRLIVTANPVQSSIESISLYPFVLALELREHKMVELIAPKRGTQWQPFLA